VRREEAKKKMEELIERWLDVDELLEYIDTFASPEEIEDIEVTMKALEIVETLIPSEDKIIEARKRLRAVLLRNELRKCKILPQTRWLESE